MNIKQAEITKLNERFASESPQKILEYILSEFKYTVAFSTSLGPEDQVLTDMIAKIDPAAKIFTLDTGRLFYETYDTIDKTNARYHINIEILFPDFLQVEEMVNEKGINLFYESVENRKLCCNVRKTLPLKRKLKDYDVWVTGIRAEQSVTRKNMELFEWEPELNMLKVNPLVDWTEEMVWAYIRELKVPYNILHDKGYLSIGCAPCTRAVEKGEPSRNGRWWWENPETRECGIHLKGKTS